MVTEARHDAAQIGFRSFNRRLECCDRQGVGRGLRTPPFGGLPSDVIRGGVGRPRPTADRIAQPAAEHRKSLRLQLVCRRECRNKRPKIFHRAQVTLEPTEVVADLALDQRGEAAVREVARFLRCLREAERDTVFLRL